MKSGSLITPKPQLESWKPKKHHRLGVEFLMKHDGGGLFLRPGMGKTSITLKAFDAFKKAGKARTMLVIAPLRPVYRVWPVEAAKWKEFAHLKVQILHDKTRSEDYFSDDVDVYVINPDGCEWLFDPEEKWRMQELNADTLVIDESTKYRNTQTQRFKLLKKVLPMFDRRWVLTGTPSPKSYIDLFGQIYICDLGHAFGPYITHYRTTYFFQTGYGGYTWALQPGADKKIQKKLKPITLHLDDKDFIDMPEEVPNVIRVDLPQKVRKYYDQMEEEMFIDLDNHEITAGNAAAAMVKCGQIANGGIYTDRKRNEFTNLHVVKIEALEELVAELNGSPLLVAYDTHHDLARLKKAFPKAPVIADIPLKKLGWFEDAWNRGDIELMFGHPQGMGHGLNLQGSGNNVCWHSLTYDYELYDQFNRRVLRSGQKNSRVFVHHIVARDTVDEPKLRALRTKDRNQRTLLNALKNYRKERSK